MTAPQYPITAVERGEGVDYYLGARLVARAMPPRPHDAWFQWRADDETGRAVEVSTKEKAIATALRYARAIEAQQWAEVS